MLVAVCPSDGSALDRPLNAGAVHPTSKGQRRVGPGVEQDVLLIDASFQFSLLARTLVMTGDDAVLLRELHSLRPILAIRPSRVNCPIPGDVGWWLLRTCHVVSPGQQVGDAEQQQLRAAVPHRRPPRWSSLRLGGIIDGQLDGGPESRSAGMLGDPYALGVDFP
jgi:hypothetical protein